MSRFKACTLSFGLICVFGCFLLDCSPQRDHGEGVLFSLEKALTIDTGNDQTAEAGLTDIFHFDIDSEGKIFVVNPKSSENYVFILNRDGGLISAFGRKGQGPGELQSIKELIISNRDEIFITDVGKVTVFDKTGRFLREFRIGEDYQKIIPLNEDRYLAIAVKLNEDLSQSFQVILCSSELEELKILDSSKIESFKKAAKVNIIPTLVYWERSNNQIFTGNTDEYEIRVFDFDGRQIRKIQWDKEAVLMSEKDREEYQRRIERYPPEIKNNFFIPDVYPPIRAIAAWGEERLFVQTYEEANPGNSMYDVFGPKGEFLSRTELDGYQVKFRGDRVYCLKQKESGHKQLVVYRIKEGDIN